MASTQLTKVTVDSLFPEIEEMTDDELMGLVKLYTDNDLGAALRKFIDLSTARLYEKAGKLDVYPIQKNAETLYKLQDTQSRILELVRIADIGRQANECLIRRHKR